MDFRTRLEIGKDGASTELDDDFRSEYFAVERVKTHPVCLDLRMREGARKALPYSFFTEISFENETGIEICTSNKKITITGRNLAKLFDYLVLYRVRYIQADVGNDGEEDGLFVKDIQVEELNDL